MKIATVCGYELHKPTSGGKAGKGRNKTSTIQVRSGTQILAQFRFSTASIFSQREALAKARQWCEVERAVEEELALRDYLRDEKI
jgi:hypothetical protein